MRAFESSLARVHGTPSGAALGRWRRPARALGGCLLFAVAGATGAMQASAQGVPAQAGHVVRPPQSWTATFGGSSSDTLSDAAAAANGGFFAVGATHSFGQGLSDAWVARIDRAGVAAWERVLGGVGTDEVRSVAATPDGGCVLAGRTRTFGAGEGDGWVVKLAANGSVQWQRSYGTAAEETFVSIAVVEGPSAASGYYVGGTQQVADADSEVWILELDALGTPLWQETFGGALDDELTALTATPTGVAFVAKSNSLFSGSAPDIPFFRPWIVGLDGDGQSLWQTTLNYSGGDALVDIQCLADGSFVLTGELLAMGFHRGDVWVVRLESTGAFVWDTAIGDNLQVNYLDSGRRVRPTPGGGFLVIGSTATAGAGSEDAWVLRLDGAGNLLEQRTLGGAGFDNGQALVVSPTGEAIVGGSMQAPNLGSLDIFLTRIGPSLVAPATSACWPLLPSGPKVASSQLTLGSSSVTPVSTAVVPATTTARASSISSGLLLCP